MWVTQSGQSELRTAGEHRPGRRAYDGRCRTGRVGRTSGLELQCTAQPGPAAAGLGTSGGVGPGADVEPAHVASAGGPGREPPMLGGSGARTRGWRRRCNLKGARGGQHRWGPHRWDPQPGPAVPGRRLSPSSSDAARPGDPVQRCVDSGHPSLSSGHTAVSP